MAEPDRVEELAGGRSHGGVVAFVGEREPVALSTVLAEVGESPLLVMLDGIEDPFNYGQAVRSLYAAGVDGLVVRRDWESALPIVTRASAGATELIPTATVADATSAATTARAGGPEGPVRGRRSIGSGPARGRPARRPARARRR